ncbi:MAG: Dabb family protein [Sedimentisphaerales bacterium]|nr:Dabb family protein [Sedimentisphaerales bacterium]
MRNVVLLALSVAGLAAGGCSHPLTSPQTREPHLAHNVYFTLNDNSPAARARLVEACYKYLKDHPGVTFFAAGEIVEAHAREVNVRDWDVGLHVVFKTRAHHDLYQEAEAHHTFIAENQDNWKTVRVFDTFVK